MAHALVRSPLVFALPADSDAPSGGNVYNQGLTRALAELAPTVITSFAGAEGRLESGEPGLYLFDTLELDGIHALPAPREGQRLGLLVHHLPSLEPGISPGDPALAREAAALPRFDVLVATSDFTRGWLIDHGVGSSRIVTVPPALTEPPSPARTYEPPLSALVVANLVRRKGVLSLLEALGALALPAAPFVLRIVGRDDLDPGYAGECRRLVASGWLRERVRLEGSLPHERMSEAYERSHLLVSASTMETFGMAIHEARAHGLAVLARDGGYVRRHFEEGASGRLVESEGALARELVRLAAHESDTRTLFERAQDARKGARPTWSSAARTLLDALDRLRVE